MSTAVALFIATPTLAADGRMISFDIPAQSLDESLRALGVSANRQVLFSANVVQGRSAKSVSGTYTTEEALKKILDGTGLTYEESPEGVFMVRAPARSAQRRAVRQGAAPEQIEGSPTQTAQANSSSADRVESAPASVEEVVVTAQKRAERLQEVPILISVLSGDALDRATAQGVSEVLNSISGVSALESYIGGGTQVAIRGVASSSPILHGSSPIAYYLDSVPFGLIKTSIAPDANAYDLERVEVLRGPQGTLYGASALNGVVRVLTRDADLNDFALNARASVSQTEHGGTNYRGDAAINVPVVEGRLGVRAVAGVQDLSGWIDRPGRTDVNSADISSFRLKANAQPSDNLSIEVLAATFEDDRAAPPQGQQTHFHAINANEPQLSTWDTYGFNLSYDFGAATLTSATSYLDYANRGVLNLEELTPFLAGREFDNRFFSEVWTQEVNVTSDASGPWRWSFGGIYRDAKDRTLQQLIGVTPTYDFDDTSKSYAVYGEATRALLDGQLELTAGLRYFHDKVATHERLPSNGIAGTPLINLESDFEKLTPRVVATWLPSDNMTAYVSYAQGFRSGFQQQPNVQFLAPSLPPVEADSLENYELGTKGRLADGVLTYEAAVYYMKWKDVQTDRSVSVAGLPVAALVNGESASGLGVDLAVALHPAEGVDFGVSFGTNDLEWDSNVLSGGAVLFQKGSRLSLSPKTSASAYFNYAFPLGDSDYEGRLSLSANYTSSQFLKIASGFGQGDSLLMGRASFTVAAPTNWEVTLYADNLFNEDGAIQQAPFTAPDWAVRPRPRTIGLQAEYRY